MDVPRELAERRQWVCWKNESGRKVPYQPNGQKAKSNDSQTWRPLADCEAASGFSGVGFVFSAEDPFCGIDLDGVYKDGEIADWAAELLECFPTYAEISPSGRGIKIWFRGRLPDGKGRRADVADGQHLEVYDRGRYFTFTGQSLDPDQNALTDCQPALDALLTRFWPPETKPAPATCQASPSVSGDVQARAVAYLEKCPPAISGQGGHGVAIRVAACLIRGFELDQETAYHVMQCWNARCQPPWSDKELRHKLSDAAKHTGERGWLLNGHAYTGPDVDLREFLASVDAVVPPERKPDVPTSPLQFPPDCLRPPGLLSQIIDWNLRTALWPQPELALAGALALLGTITGRKVQDTRRTRTNVYCLGLAASGAGKEHARLCNKEILLRAGAEKLLGPEGIASSAGLVQFVNGQREILFQLDEISRLLETMRDPRKAPHLFKIGSELMKLDSCANTLYKGDAYANQKQSVVIDQPHCCIYGTAVPDGFWRSLTDDNVSEGLLGRIFVFESSRRYVDIATPEYCHPPEELLDGVRWWLKRPYGTGELSEEHPDPAIIPYEPDAQRRIDDHMKGICRQRAKEDDTRAALWSRTTGKTAKLSLLLACSRATGETVFRIEKEDVDRAIKISNWLTRRMIWQAYRHVAANEREGSAKKVLRMMGTWISRSELTRKTQWLDRRRRDEILTELVECGLVEMETVGTGQKAAQRFKERA